MSISLYFFAIVCFLIVNQKHCFYFFSTQKEMQAEGNLKDAKALIGSLNSKVSSAIKKLHAAKASGALSGGRRRRRKSTGTKRRGKKCGK
jgi:hypothetical protein